MSSTDKAVGQRYNDLNSYEKIKAINKITDPREKNNAMEKMAKDVVQALRQLNKAGGY